MQRIIAVGTLPWQSRGSPVWQQARMLGINAVVDTLPAARPGHPGVTAALCVVGQHNEGVLHAQLGHCSSGAQEHSEMRLLA